jgi:predicted metalloendopeptidase
LARPRRPTSAEDARYFVTWIDAALQLIPQRTFYTEQQKLQTVAVYQKAREKFIQMAGAGAKTK